MQIFVSHEKYINELYYFIMFAIKNPHDRLMQCIIYSENSIDYWLIRKVHKNLICFFTVTIVNMSDKVYN